MPKQASLFPDNYDEFFRQLKERIRSAQIKAALSVNQELVLLYWHIGREILQRQQEEGWGAKVIEHASREPKATVSTRSKNRVSGNDRHLSTQPQLYAVFCRSVP